MWGWAEGSVWRRHDGDLQQEAYVGSSTQYLNHTKSSTWENRAGWILQTLCVWSSVTISVYICTYHSCRCILTSLGLSSFLFISALHFKTTKYIIFIKRSPSFQQEYTDTMFWRYITQLLYFMCNSHIYFQAFVLLYHDNNETMFKVCQGNYCIVIVSESWELRAKVFMAVCWFECGVYVFAEWVCLCAPRLEFTSDHGPRPCDLQKGYLCMFR